ncbi:MAG TPA: TIGR03067 domain-containing protein [Candidatus Methylomirabilis sp.]|nr:TIGR03067 domain-containing protein [Candidatus Methylomirabilis sp.]
MRKSRGSALIVVSLVGSLLVTAASGQDSGKIQGAWIVVSAERDAKPAADVTGHRLTFSGDTFTIQLDGNTLYRGTFSVDVARKPAQIDFHHTEGTIKGKTWRGIYRIEGAGLRICDNAPDLRRPRPTTFSAVPGAGSICIIFKRATG